MRGLSAADVVAVWERGQERHPVDRALLLLGAALPARSRDELAALSVGQRDGLLLLARERTLGPTLQCFVPCPACAQSLEFPVEVREILVADPQAPLKREQLGPQPPRSAPPEGQAPPRPQGAAARQAACPHRPPRP